jgi:hypothetical protein
MKIKDIVDEGVISSFAKGLLPDTVQKVLDAPYNLPGKGKGESSEELAKNAYKKFGENPYMAGLPKEYGYLGYLNQYELSNIIPRLPSAIKQKLPPDLKARYGVK